MKKIITAIITLFIIVVSAMTTKADSYRGLNIGNPEIVKEGDILHIKMNIEPMTQKMRTDGIVRIIPVVKSAEGNDSVEMPALTLTGRNAWYSVVRRNGMKVPPFTYNANDGKTETYDATTPWQPWMESSTVSLRKEQECCGHVTSVAGNYDFATLDFTPVEFKTTTLEMVAPVSSGPKIRELSGKAYVNFPVNRTEIYPNYMNNPLELKKIISTIDEVKNNPDVTVDMISLTGYASPEGAWSNNVRLASGRTEAVKEYVRRQYNFPSTVYKTNSVPEDWQGLREYVEQSTLKDREGIIKLIDDKSIPDPDRNDVLKARFPESYSFLLKGEYPWLRHTDYVITYTVRNYTDVEEIKQILKTAPGQLSLSELYQVAQSYGEGTPEYDEVFEVAVRLYPEDEVANLNAANTAIRSGNYERARTLLAKAGESGHANYARGVLAAIQEDYAESKTFLGKASTQGIDTTQAMKNLEKITDKNAGRVTFAQ